MITPKRRLWVGNQKLPRPPISEIGFSFTILWGMKPVNLRSNISIMYFLNLSVSSLNFSYPPHIEYTVSSSLFFSWILYVDANNVLVIFCNLFISFSLFIISSLHVLHVCTSCFVCAFLNYLKSYFTSIVCHLISSPFSFFICS